MRSRASQRILSVTMLAVCLSSSSGESVACTTFSLSDGGAVVFGRNYDFDIGDGLVVVNKRGVSKVSKFGGGRSETSPPKASKTADSDRQARWVSRYASVTFNQYGREFPTGGMNEKGLVVELMWLDGTVYPPRDARPVVGVLEWIQYQLDTRASVAELIAHADEIRVRGSVPLHYLVADRTSATATIEFLDGRMKVHQGKSLPVPVLANHAYEKSLASLSAYTGFGGSATPPNGPGSLARFARAASMVRSFPGTAARPSGSDPSDNRSSGAGSPGTIDYAFEILSSVAQGEHTRWSIVYDMKNLEVHFRTWSHPELRTLRLSAFDKSCSTPVKILDVNAPLSGDVTNRFADYTPQANLELVEGSYRQVSFLSGVPRSEIEGAARHPETMACTSSQ